MKKKLIFLLFLCLGIRAFSQNQGKAEDSLIQVLKTGKEDTNKVYVLTALANLYLTKNDFTKAMNSATDALTLSQKINFKRGIVNSYNVIGNVFGGQGNDAEGLKNLLLALKEVEETGDKSSIAIAYSHIGGFYLNHKRYPDALKNFLVALQTSKDLHNEQYMAVCYLNIGVVYQLQNNYEQALENYLAALKIKEKMGDKGGMSNSIVNIGDLYLKLKKWDEAKDYINKGLQLSQQAGSKMGMAASYINFGELYIHLQKFPEAREYLNKGLQLSKEIKNKDYIKETYYNLSALDSIKGDYKEAYQYYQLYTIMKDSIQNEESEKQVSQLNIKYETEKKDKDILIKTVEIGKQKTFIIYLIIFFVLLALFAFIYFQLYNQKRRTTFRHQILETEMKALRSQMNPHFTFNVLNSIQYFISENDTDSAELYIEKFSSLIRMILDQSRTAYITLEQEVAILKLYLELEEMRFEKKFTYSINIDSSINTGVILIPGMLMQPIVENAIKHGIEHKEGNALISISFSIKDSFLLCSVTDNGIGRKEAEKLNGGRIHKSAATAIIKERMEALSSIYNITLSYKTEDLFNSEGRAEGTCVSMEIPIGIKNQSQDV